MDVTAVPYAEALADVQARVAKSRTSFHAGMAILPKERREAMYALYAFCREVDDIADDSATPQEAAKGLARWRQRIADLFRGAASDSITSALLPAVATYKLDEADFQAIIDGMDMDAVVICAPDEKTFDVYCDRVASAVGRVSVRIFGDASDSAMQVAHHLGRALQITNILRDIAEDAARGRLYLPKELLTRHGLIDRDCRKEQTSSSPASGGESDLSLPPINPAEIARDNRLPAACRELAERAGLHFAAADRAMKACLPAAMRPARIMRAYYGAIYNRLLRADWQNVDKRISLPIWQKIGLILRHGVFR